MGTHCSHNDVKEVLQIGSCQVWGGKETQVLKRGSEFDVIISLLGPMRGRATKFTLSRGSRRTFAALNAYQQRRNNILSIDWPDMAAPDLDREFWEALAQDLSQVKGKAAIFCMGGHGRTGTALCSLIQVSNYRPALDSGDALAWVRTHYCGDAVETASQVDYLRQTMGLVTAMKSSRSWESETPKAERGMSQYFRKSGHADQRELLDFDRLTAGSLEYE